EIAVLRAAEGERDHARGGGRHGIGIEHAERALDRDDELERARRDAALAFEHADHRVPAPDLVRPFDLGQKKPREPGDADHRVEIVGGEACLEPVHAYPNPSARDLRRVFAYAGARIGLFRRRYRVLKIEDEGIRRQPDRLLQEFLTIGRNVDEAARERHKPSSLCVSARRNYCAASTLAFAPAIRVTPAAASSRIAAGE